MGSRKTSHSFLAFLPISLFFYLLLSSTSWGVWRLRIPRWTSFGGLLLWRFIILLSCSLLRDGNDHPCPDYLYPGYIELRFHHIKLLKQEDTVVSTYRDHVHALSKGVPAREVMGELFGKTTGCCRGQGGSMHMFSKEHNLIGGFAFIGEGIPVATGAAFTSKYKREVLKRADCDHVTVAFFGDGTCNNGQFFECLNMAALWKLPIIFVVENNLWAIGMSHLRATSDPEIWKKGPAFGMPGFHVDGMDVLKVREVAKEAVGRARRGEGPTLVECETYRFRGHSLADPDELRDPGKHFTSVPH